MAKQKLNGLQEQENPYAYGWVGGETAAGNSSLTNVTSDGIIVSGVTATIQVKGVYMIHFQQLVNYAGAFNFYIRKNDVGIARGWQSNIQKDIMASCITTCNVGDTIRFWKDLAVSNVWSDTHSSWYIVLVRRLP